jgi:hypothetical protein
VPCPALDDGGPHRHARWGEQLDVRNITTGDSEAGELSAEQVAGHIAKYATKATESFGAGLDRRRNDDDLKRLDKLPAHVAELVRACWELGGRPELTSLRLRAWAHMRYLNPVEVACLAEAIRPGDRALVLVGASGGMRIGLARSREDPAKSR